MELAKFTRLGSQIRCKHRDAWSGLRFGVSELSRIGARFAAMNTDGQTSSLRFAGLSQFTAPEETGIPSVPIRETLKYEPGSCSSTDSDDNWP